MKYALNLAKDNRILSACKVLPKGSYDNMPIVDVLPEGNLFDYLYIDDGYVYNPLPIEEIIEKPSQLDIIEAQITYTAMMTNTLLEEEQEVIKE